MADDPQTGGTALHLEFSGGLDSLTLNQTRELRLRLAGAGATLGHLIAFVRKHVVGAKKDLFAFAPELAGADAARIAVSSDPPGFEGLLSLGERCKIRPGVLVLVNDVDWELLAREATALRGGDRVTFISTLHGG